MQIYLAGASEINRLVTRGYVQDYKSMSRGLLSFWSESDRAFLKQHKDQIIKDKVDLFLDSGAYSAMTRGVEINLDEYICFIKKHQDALKIYAVLDVIGDAEKTLVNQEKMEAAGLTPLWCFHTGEDFRALRRAVGKYSYIACGGMQDAGWGRVKVQHWLGKVRNITEPARVKVHGFAMSGYQFMQDVPFLYSVDSLGWKFKAAMGVVLIPPAITEGDGTIWSNIHYELAVTPRRRWDIVERKDLQDPTVVGKDGTVVQSSFSSKFRHFDKLKRHEQDLVVAYFEFMGEHFFGDPKKFEHEKLKVDSNLRGLLNMLWYREYGEKLESRVKVRRLF